jgi:MoaD family protein
MSIRVNFHSNLSRITGRERIELDALYSDVRSLLEGLVSTFPALSDELFDSDGRLDFEYQILLNGRSINAQGGVAAPLKDGDEITFLMPLSGG